MYLNDVRHPIVGRREVVVERHEPLHRVPHDVDPVGSKPARNSQDLGVDEVEMSVEGKWPLAALLIKL